MELGKLGGQKIGRWRLGLGKGGRPAARGVPHIYSVEIHITATVYRLYQLFCSFQTIKPPGCPKGLRFITVLMPPKRLQTLHLTR